MYRLRKVGKKERRLFGVLGGISKYIDPTVDPTILRILFVLLGLFNPVGFIIIYVIMACVLKTEDYETSVYNRYPIDSVDIIKEREEKIKEMADEQRKEEDEKEDEKKEDE